MMLTIASWATIRSVASWARVSRLASRQAPSGRQCCESLQGRHDYWLENYRVFGPNSTPATLSFHIEWQATDPFVDRGKDATVPPTDPAAFLARFAVARSTAEFEVSEFGFSFRSDPGVSTDQGFAEMGRERNGVLPS